MCVFVCVCKEMYTRKTGKKTAKKKRRLRQKRLLLRHMQDKADADTRKKKQAQAQTWPRLA